jgi:hypothetical protein
VTNHLNFSTAKTFCGFVNPRVRSNDKIPNPNVTVLEWLHKKSSYQGKIAAFGAWDVFPEAGKATSPSPKARAKPTESCPVLLASGSSRLRKHAGQNGDHSRKRPEAMSRHKRAVMCPSTFSHRSASFARLLSVEFVTFLAHPFATDQTDLAVPHPRS